MKGLAAQIVRPREAAGGSENGSRDAKSRTLSLKRRLVSVHESHEASKATMNPLAGGQHSLQPQRSPVAVLLAVCSVGLRRGSVCRVLPRHTQRTRFHLKLHHN